jgi:hypothetical protein
VFLTTKNSWTTTWKDTFFSTQPSARWPANIADTPLQCCPNLLVRFAWERRTLGWQRWGLRAGWQYRRRFEWMGVIVCKSCLLRWVSGFREADIDAQGIFVAMAAQWHTRRCWIHQIHGIDPDSYNAFIMVKVQMKAQHPPLSCTHLIPCRKHRNGFLSRYIIELPVSRSHAVPTLGHFKSYTGAFYSDGFPSRWLSCAA